MKYRLRLFLVVEFVYQTRFSFPITGGQMDCRTEIHALNVC